MSNSQLNDDDIGNNIVIVEELSANSECSSIKSHDGAVEKVRPVRRTDAQFEKLSSFMVRYPDFPQGKNNETQLLEFDRLCTEMNKIGPPVHSSFRWRKLWSDYKGNKKRSSTSKNTIAETYEMTQGLVESSSSSYSVQVHQYDPSKDRSKRFKKDEADKENLHSPDYSNIKSTKQCDHHLVSIKLLEMILEQQKESIQQQVGTNKQLTKLIEILTPQSVDDV